MQAKDGNRCQSVPSNGIIDAAAGGPTARKHLTKSDHCSSKCGIYNFRTQWGFHTFGHYGCTSRRARHQVFKPFPMHNLCRLFVIWSRLYLRHRAHSMWGFCLPTSYYPFSFCFFSLSFALFSGVLLSECPGLKRVGLMITWMSRWQMLKVLAMRCWNTWIGFRQTGGSWSSCFWL